MAVEEKKVSYDGVTQKKAEDAYDDSNAFLQFGYGTVKDRSKYIHPQTKNVSPEDLHKQLIQTVRRFCPKIGTDMIEKACVLATEAHKIQKRKSGEPYIIHPLSVATILAELGMDEASIVAGILHDVVEDTDYTLDDIKEMFGDEVAELVDGVTKLTRLNWSGGKEEKQAENLRKMFLAMAKDIRVIIIKLADRTHNMRTLQHMPPEKQIEKAKETMDIYVPLASRLGISKLKIELDNLALSYLYPEDYRKLVESIDLRKQKREEYIEEIVNEIEGHLKKNGVECEVYGRVKHYFSIYKKMKVQHKTIDEIYDLFAVRVLVNTVSDCYAVLGLIHEMYKPVPGRFKDYIAMPKPNKYQSLHTTLIGRTGTPFEVQIRTYEMHRVAEYGIAAHWKYKESGSGAMLSSEEEKLSWLRQILEWQKDMADNMEFLSSIKNSLNVFSERIYCFTPEGDVKELPQGATPIDFAYSIHSAIGNRMVGARVNDRLVPIDYQIKNGDRVEIMTSMNSKGPSRDWLNIVRSTQARKKINDWFKTLNREDNIQAGRETLERYCQAKGHVFSELARPEYINKVLQKYSFKEWDAVLAAVGHGGLKEGQVVNKLLEEKKKHDKNAITDEEILEAAEKKPEDAHRQIRSKSGIVVEGISDLAVHFSKCCNPIPGDEIVGYVTRGRGISIHRTDCINVVNLPAIERSRLIDAEWSAASDRQKVQYEAEICVYANDRMGLLADISRVMTELGVGINSINSRTNRQKVASFVIKFNIGGVDEIQKIVARMRQIDGVIDVERKMG